MSSLTAAEQDALDRAEHDGAGWVMPSNVPAELMQQLATAGLVRFWARRWQLSPEGFARSSMFNRK
jgi:hypothetical protein